MFAKSFVGACIAGAALSINIEHIHQTPAALTEILSQTEAGSISAAICLRTAARNKAALPNFYEILGGSAKYTDTDFKHDWSSFAWKDAGEKFDEVEEAEVTWKRASVAFPKKTLFGTNGITPNDIRQGAIGNCWFMSAAAALAEEKGRMESVFLNSEVNANGIYGVNLYTLGVPHTVIVDDYLPLMDKGDGTFAT